MGPRPLTADRLQAAIDDRRCRLTPARALVWGICLVVTTAALVGIATAETTTIDFEDVDGGTQLTTQYSDEGVRFEVPEGASTGAIVEACGPDNPDCPSARSGEHAIRSQLLLERTRHPLLLSFGEGHQTVSLAVREGDDVGGPRTARLVARDDAGTVVAESAVEFDPDTGWHRLTVTAPAATITRARLTLAETVRPDSPRNQFLVDDLAFGTNERPKAAVDLRTDDATAGDLVRFDASSSVDPDGDIAVYSWDFDDDGRIDANTTSPFVSHTYPEPGSYRATLRVVDDGGAVGATEQIVRVVQAPPDGVSPWALVGLAVLGLVGTWVVGKGISRWRGNGEDDDRSGDDDDGTDEDEDEESNRPPTPDVAFVPREPVAGRPVLFDGTLSFDPDEDDRVAEFRWTVGAVEIASPRLVYAFDEPGDYDVTLAVSDTRKSTATTTETVTVAEREGELVLRRVHPDAPGDDHENLRRESLVFANAGDETLSLGGWTVHDAAEAAGRVRTGEHTFAFPDGFELAPDETVTVHTGDAPADGPGSTEAGGAHHCYWGQSAAVWNNDADIVVVEDENGDPVLAVRYERTAAGEYELERMDVATLEGLFADGDD